MTDKQKRQYGRDGKPASRSVNLQEGYNGKLTTQVSAVQPPKKLPPPPPPKKG